MIPDMRTPGQDRSLNVEPAAGIGFGKSVGQGTAERQINTLADLGAALGHAEAPLWEDRNGNSQTQLTITADSIAFIGAGKRDAAGARAEDNAPAPSAAPQDDTDDLPF